MIKISIVNIAREIKVIHPNEIALIKVGKFYHAYGKDAYIISYVFNYQIKKVENNISTIGFPETALIKIKSKLEEKKLNYLIIDRGANYEVVEEEDFKTENTYTEYYNKANRFIGIKKKIDEIYEYLVDNISDETIKEKLVRIDEIIYEG